MQEGRRLYEQKNYLLNIVTTLVIVLIILLAGYILLDDMEGYNKNRRESLKGITIQENESKPAFVGTVDDTYYMVVFKRMHTIGRV